MRSWGYFLSWQLSVYSWQFTVTIPFFIKGCFRAAFVRNDDEIKYTILRSYFSFLRGVKSANSTLFKDFYNEVKMEKNK